MKTKYKFTRSRSNYLLAGVLGGISEQLGWNANLVRLLFIVICLTPGIGWLALIAYIVLAIVLPEGADKGNNQGSPNFNSVFNNSPKTNQSKDRKIIRGEEHDVKK